MAAMGLLFSILAGEIDGGWLRSFSEFIVFGSIAALITSGYWTLIMGTILRRYRAPNELDPDSRYATVAVLLMFFGMQGGHRFFVGRWKTGILYFCTFGIIGAGVLTDMIALMLNRFTDSRGRVD